MDLKAKGGALPPPRRAEARAGPAPAARGLQPVLGQERLYPEDLRESLPEPPRRARGGRPVREAAARVVRGAARGVASAGGGAVTVRVYALGIALLLSALTGFALADRDWTEAVAWGTLAFIFAVLVMREDSGRPL